MATQAIEKKTAAPIATLRDLLEKSKDQIATALPKHMKAERMIRVAITAAQRQPKLLECDPISFIGCIIQSAQLGLEPGDSVLGEAYLIPYWNGKTKKLEAQFQAGYRGLIALARRSGQVSWIVSEPVYECDKRFEITLGIERNIIHFPDLDNPERGANIGEGGIPEGLRGVYTVVKFKDGTTDFEYMPIHEILRIRDSSKSKDKETGEVYGPWATHFVEMAKKTPIRRLAKRLPLSPEFQKAAVLDEYVEQGVAPSMSFVPENDSIRTATDMVTARLADKYATEVPQTLPPAPCPACGQTGCKCTVEAQTAAAQAKLEKQRKAEPPKQQPSEQDRTEVPMASNPSPEGTVQGQTSPAQPEPQANLGLPLNFNADAEDDLDAHIGPRSK